MAELPTFYQQYIHRSRYSRFRDDLGRRETWPETVDRYVDFLRKHLDSNDPVLDELRESVLNLETLPSMRALMTAGKALEKDNIAAFNCSYRAVDEPRAFDEILYVLMNGTGVGYSVERQYINKLPEIPDEMQDSETTIVVRDSKLGWAEALRELISLLYSGHVPQWDTSKVRPKGSRLKTFGGRASGSHPLENLFNFAVEIFRNAAGRKLNSLECHDLVCKIADIVVVGGVRRAALISMSNLTDERMRGAKAGRWWEDNPQRALANNSVAYTEAPDMEIFMKEWFNLVESKSGERGIFNVRAAEDKFEKINEEAGYERRPWDESVRCNPCFTGDTPLLTSEGYQPIGDLVGKPVDIWNGAEWSTVSPFSTGTNEIVTVNLSDGTSLDCTPYHKFLIVEGFRNDKAERIEAQDLQEGMKLQKWDMPVVEEGEDYSIDAYSQGFYSGDGTKGQNHSRVYGPKTPCMKRLIGTVGSYSEDFDCYRWKHGPMYDKSFVPIHGSLDYCLNWLAGVLDADGTVTRDANGNGLQIVSIDHDFLYNMKTMLSRMGVRAKVVHADDEGMEFITNQQGDSGWYRTKETKRLLIGNQDTYHLMQLGIIFNRLDVHPNPPQRDARQYVRVKSVEWTGREEETFCVTEPLRNQMTVDGVVTGNCSEILLKNKQKCNLTEVVARVDDDFESLKRKVRIAAIMGTFQASLTNFRHLSKDWKRNAENEALLGVSITGIMDNPILANQMDDDLEGLLDELRQYAVEVNREWAHKIGTNPAAAVTTVKPSGTASQLVNSSSGIHARYAPYYIRAVRADNKDPLAKFMIDKDFPYEVDQMNPHNYVFYFPVKAPDGAVCTEDRTAIEELEHWSIYNRHFTEHKPSVTINVQDDEWLDVGAWVWNHFSEVSGVSFLPYHGHVYAQAPYQPLTKKQYEEWVERMPDGVDWNELAAYESADNVQNEGTQELACSAGACEI